MALVLLLRGVNVGGHRTFRPTKLTEQLKHLDAVNIGAAGTFVIRRSVSRAKLRAELARRLPFDAEIMICQGREIVRLVSKKPFADQPVRPDIVRFVSLLSRRPRSAPSTPMRFPPSGKWLLKILAGDNRFVFGVYRRHMKVIGYLGKLDRVFGVPVTTRNWNTITAIARVLEVRSKMHSQSPFTKEKNMKRSGSTENPSASQLIDKRIAHLEDWRGEVLSMMRKLIQDADPDVVEEVKWRKPSNSMLGVPVWSHDGIICTGETYKDKVKLTFAKGASLKDTGKLFNSSLDGNIRRAIDIHEGEKVDARAFKALVRAAVDLNTARGKEKPKRRK